MTRFHLVALGAALALAAIVFAPMATAQEAKKTQLASKCYPMERTIVSTGTKDTEVARAGAQMLNTMRKEGFSEFIILEGGGHKVLCGLPDDD